MNPCPSLTQQKDDRGQPALGTSFWQLWVSMPCGVSMSCAISIAMRQAHLRGSLEKTWWQQGEALGAGLLDIAVSTVVSLHTTPLLALVLVLLLLLLSGYNDPQALPLTLLLGQGRTGPEGPLPTIRGGWLSAHCARGSDARAHTPFVKGRLILLLVHGIIDVLVVVPPGRPSWRRLRLVQDARDVLHALRQDRQR